MKIRREVAPGIVQITLDESRWYRVEIDTNEYEYYPSVTWILESYPKDYAFHKYLASLPSFEVGQQILHDAGNRGKKVHAGVEKLLRNELLSIHDIMPNQYEEFTGKEWQYVLTFTEWWKKYKPLVINIEEVIYNDEFNYAGTTDLICKIDQGRFAKGGHDTGEFFTGIVDWKTSANIYESYKLQIAAYAQSYDPEKLDFIGIVRLGSRHKCGYEFWYTFDKDEILKYFQLFLSVREIWQHENGDAKPKIIDVPETLTLTEESDVEKKHKNESVGGQEGENINGEENKNEPGQGISDQSELF